MKKEKEHLKIVIIHFLIAYILTTSILFLLNKFRYNYDYALNNFRLISILAFISSFYPTINLWYSIQYKILKIPKNSIKDIDKMNDFLSSNKISFIYSSIDTQIYKIKTMHSIIPLKFSISEKESNYLIVLPKIIIPKILDD